MSSISLLNLCNAQTLISPSQATAEDFGGRCLNDDPVQGRFEIQHATPSLADNAVRGTVERCCF